MNFITKWALFCLALTGCSSEYRAQQQTLATPPVLQPLNQIDLFPTDDLEPVVRSRTVKVDFTEVLRPAATVFDVEAVSDTAQRRLILNLFEDIVLSVIIDEVIPKSGSDMLMRGHVEGDFESLVILNIKDKILIGQVDYNGKTYSIRSTQNDLHSVREIDVAKLDEMDLHSNESDQKIPPDSDESVSISEAVQDMITANDLPEPVTIDIMVAYTAAARGSSTHEAMVGTIENAIVAANESYINSQINQRLRLVHVYQTNYDQNKNHLEVLTGTSDGYMDEIHSLRNQYGADIATLLVSSASYCGQGWLLTGSHVGRTSFAPWAFNVVVRSCLNNLTLVHEVGHNMGAMHDRANSNNQGAYTYSYGYGNGTYRSIMAYVGGSRIRQFSSATIKWNNTILGDLSNDNSRTLNSTALTVAGLKGGRLPSSTNQAPIANAGLDQSVAIGSLVLLNGASSYDPEGQSLSYQWKIESGPTSVSLSSSTAQKPNFYASAAGTYRLSLVVSDGTLSSAKDYVDIVVNNITAPPTMTAPSITAQPLSQSVIESSNVTFSVTATSSVAMTYQWYKGEVAILGKTERTLYLSNVQLSDAGDYKVVVKNSVGSTASSIAQLNVVAQSTGSEINAFTLSSVTPYTYDTNYTYGVSFSTSRPITITQLSVNGLLNGSSNNVGIWVDGGSSSPTPIATFTVVTGTQMGVSAIPVNILLPAGKYRIGAAFKRGNRSISKSSIVVGSSITLHGGVTSYGSTLRYPSSYISSYVKGHVNFKYK